jgi:hypothetical protein
MPQPECGGLRIQPFHKFLEAKAIIQIDYLMKTFTNL